MIFQNTAPAPRTFTLLRDRTTSGKAKAKVITVGPGQQADFDAADLTQIAKSRAMSAIFERDMIPGRTDLQTAGKVEPRGAVISDKMAQLIAMAEAGQASADQAAHKIERDSGAVSADLASERERLSLRAPRSVQLGEGLVMPPGVRLSAADAARMAARSEGISEVAEVAPDLGRAYGELRGRHLDLDAEERELERRGRAVDERRRAIEESEGQLAARGTTSPAKPVPAGDGAPAAAPTSPAPAPEGQPEVQVAPSATVPDPATQLEQLRTQGGGGRSGGRGGRG